MSNLGYGLGAQQECRAPQVERERVMGSAPPTLKPTLQQDLDNLRQELSAIAGVIDQAEGVLRPVLRPTNEVDAREGDKHPEPSRSEAGTELVSLCNVAQQCRRGLLSIILRVEL